jgi:ATP-binding cassette subfamily B protein
VRPWKAALGLALLFNLVEVGAALVQPLLIRRAIDDHIAAGDIDGLAVVVAIYAGVVLLDFGARGVGMYLLDSSAMRALASVRSAVFRHVIAQGQRFFDRRTTGSLMTRTVNDVEAIYESLAHGALNLITDALTIAGILVVMLALDWQLTLVAFSISPLIVAVVNLFRRRLRDLSLIIRKSLSRLNGFFAEQIYGMHLVQLYGATEASRKTFQGHGYEYLDAYRRSNWWDAGLYAIMDGLSALSTGALLWYGASRFGVEGSAVTLGLLVAFVDYLRRIYVPIREFSGRLATIQRAIAALERVFSLLDTSDRITAGTIALPHAEGQVAFDAVSFRYAPDKPLVLNDVSFRMRPGEVVALVGATGSGKTTIGKVLLRLYDGYEGSVTVDGHELRDVVATDLRAAVTVVHQDVYLFNGTVHDNIALWSPDIDAAAVRQAARLARADEFIERGLGGYDRVIAERGGNLSSGQKQLLAIARAMARDAPIVILDEATSSVDSVTERLIDEAVEELLARKTVLVIAHRLSTIMKADRILVLHRGRVVEEGTHDQLVARGGRYARLVETGFAAA